MNHINCIFCDIKSDKVVIEENGFSGLQCPSCNLIYISPRPSMDEIIDLYGHDHAQTSAASLIKASYSKTLYAKHHLEIVRKYINSGDLLEIGAGGGYFLYEARKLGFNPLGIEFNSMQASHIRDNLNIPCEEEALGGNSFGDQQFDIIYHCDVISHFYDPILEFERINRKLKDGGFVVFETGNLGDVDHKYFKYVRTFQYPDHLFFYSAENLTSLLEKTGFKPKEIRRYSILPQMIILKNMTWLANLIKPKSRQIKVDETNPQKPVLKSGSSLKQKFINIFYYLNYLVRYKIGAFMPKNKKPQTVIVVAQKVSSV